jgi:hypothetical protein
MQRQRTLTARLAWSVMALVAANLVYAEDDSVLKTKDVILVHGAWADGSSWSKVIPWVRLHRSHSAQK